MGINLAYVEGRARRVWGSGWERWKEKFFFCVCLTLMSKMKQLRCGFQNVSGGACPSFSWLLAASHCQSVPPRLKIYRSPLVYIQCAWVCASNAIDCTVIPHLFKWMIKFRDVIVFDDVCQFLTTLGDNTCQQAHDLWPSKSCLCSDWWLFWRIRSSMVSHTHTTATSTVHRVTIPVAALSTVLTGVTPSCWISRGFPTFHSYTSQLFLPFKFYT